MPQLSPDVYEKEIRQVRVGIEFHPIVRFHTTLKNAKNEQICRRDTKLSMRFSYGSRSKARSCQGTKAAQFRRIAQILSYLRKLSDKKREKSLLKGTSQGANTTEKEMTR